jgi:hypothetical protein
MIENTANGEKELYANVWNWDSTWKVEWHVDGTPKGALRRVDSFDPLAVALYMGDKLPKPRPFVEPRLTEHMFRAIIPKGAKEIKIVATDRFGNKYQTTA